jgi:hypothetical protein
MKERRQAGAGGGGEKRDKSRARSERRDRSEKKDGSAGVKKDQRNSSGQRNTDRNRSAKTNRRVGARSGQRNDEKMRSGKRSERRSNRRSSDRQASSKDRDVNKRDNSRAKSPVGGQNKRSQERKRSADRRSRGRSGVSGNVQSGNDPDGEELDSMSLSSDSEEVEEMMEQEKDGSHQEVDLIEVEGEFLFEKEGSHEQAPPGNFQACVRKTLMPIQVGAQCDVVEWNNSVGEQSERIAAAFFSMDGAGGGPGRRDGKIHGISTSGNGSGKRSGNAGGGKASGQCGVVYGGVLANDEENHLSVNKNGSNLSENDSNLIHANDSADVSRLSVATTEEMVCGVTETVACLIEAAAEKANNVKGNNVRGNNATTNASSDQNNKSLQSSLQSSRHSNRFTGHSYSAFGKENLITADNVLCQLVWLEERAKADDIDVDHLAEEIFQDIQREAGNISEFDQVGVRQNSTKLESGQQLANFANLISSPQDVISKLLRPRIFPLLQSLEINQSLRKYSQNDHNFKFKVHNKLTLRNETQEVVVNQNHTIRTSLQYDSMEICPNHESIQIYPN